MTRIVLERLERLAQKFPSLLPTVAKLNQAGIPYAIGGSGCLYLLGNEREPNDVDIFVPDERHDEADALFGIVSFTHQSAIDRARNSNPGQDHAMQLTSHLLFTVGGREYPLRLTPAMLEQRPRVEYKGQMFYLLPPEDALLDKAILQRGEEVGKHDVADIKNFLHKYSHLDRAYLQDRIDALDAQERVGSIFV